MKNIFPKLVIKPQAIHTLNGNIKPDGLIVDRNQVIFVDIKRSDTSIFQSRSCIKRYIPHCDILWIVYRYSNKKWRPIHLLEGYDRKVVMIHESVIRLLRKLNHNLENHPINLY